MSYRVIPAFSQFLTNAGQVLAGGTVNTYLTDLTTPALTYADEELTTSNGFAVTLDAYGRPPVAMWSDVPLGVIVRDSLGAEIKSANNVPGYGGNDADTLPAGNEPGDLLQWDGTAWVPVEGILVPDPEDLSNHYLVSDGSPLPVWQQIPAAQEIPDPEIVIVDTAPLSVRVGVSDDTTKYLRQFGSGTVPAAAARTSSVEITLDTILDKAFAVHITPRTSVVSTHAGHAIGATYAVTGYTVGSAMTSFTVTVNSVDDGGESNYNIENPWLFDWCAEGTVTVEAEE